MVVLLIALVFFVLLAILGPLFGADSRVSGVASPESNPAASSGRARAEGGGTAGGPPWRGAAQSQSFAPGGPSSDLPGPPLSRAARRTSAARRRTAGRGGVVRGGVAALRAGDADVVTDERFSRRRSRSRRCVDHTGR